MAGKGAAGGPGQSQPITYAQAGVDIDAGNALVKAIKPLAKSTVRPGADADLGGFGALFDLKRAGFKDPILVAANDGVGTKLKIAIDTGMHATIGIDLVAMCVNDLLAQGAEPLFFLDYFATGKLDVFDPPTPNSGARRVWSDSKGRLWISEWNSGNVSMYDPAAKGWKQWKLPGDKPRAYAVWVDPDDKVWLTDWTANAVVRFDPDTEKFESFPSDRPNSNLRQLLGRKGEAWIAESGTERIRLIRYAAKTN